MDGYEEGASRRVEGGNGRAGGGGRRREEAPVEIEQKQRRSNRSSCGEIELMKRELMKRVNQRGGEVVISAWTMSASRRGLEDIFK
ncbi:hypothetical protein R6Q59_006306 [Mikania micrantha]